MTIILKILKDKEIMTIIKKKRKETSCEDEQRQGSSHDYTAGHRDSRL